MEQLTGRDLDAAERAMGWVFCDSDGVSMTGKPPDPEKYEHHGCGIKGSYHVPRYSSDLTVCRAAELALAAKDVLYKYHYAILLHNATVMNDEAKGMAGWEDLWRLATAPPDVRCRALLAAMDAVEKS